MLTAQPGQPTDQFKEYFPVKASELKPGRAIVMDGQVWVVTNSDHVKPGKGPAYAQVKFKSATGSGTTEKRFRSVEDVEQAVIDRREMEYLYSDGTGAVFMDNESYDQSTVHESVLGDAMQYLKPNTQIVVLMYNDSPISIEMPAAVELQITDTQPGIKGATATNQLKEAICETGLKTRVPPFVETGEVIKVSTETGEYLGRVKE
jgi:elongation factor P